MLAVALHGAGVLAILHALPAAAPAGESRALEVALISAPAPAAARQQAPAPAAAPSPPEPAPVARLPRKKAPAPVQPRRVAKAPAETAVTLPAAAEPTVQAQDSEVEAAAPPAAAPAAHGTPAAEPGMVAPRFDADYLNNPAPAYPLQARRRREEGEVLLLVMVSEDGLPRRITLARSSGSRQLDAAARDAVERWRFVPARRGERAVEASVLVPVVFKLGGH
nr:energy transducer TonB [Thauera linaloolentis]